MYLTLFYFNKKKIEDEKLISVRSLEPEVQRTRVSKPIPISKIFIRKARRKANVSTKQVISSIQKTITKSNQLDKICRKNKINK